MTQCELLPLVYGQDGHLVIQTLATGECLNLTKPEGQRDNFPRWSPDGTELIFSSARMGFKDERAVGLDRQPYGEIFTIRADRSGLRQLTDDQFEEGTAAWLKQNK